MLGERGDQVVQTPPGGGTMIVAGFLVAMDRTSTRSEGGNAPRASRARGILQAVEPVRQITLTPSAHRMALTGHIPRKPATQSIGKLPPSPREACHVDHGKVATHSRRSLPRRSAATLGGRVLFCDCSSCQPRLPFPHGFALQRELVGVMHQAVEDRVGQCRIPQGLMPVLDRQLTGHQRGPAIMAIFDDLQQVATIFITERRQAPVIENQQVGLGQGRQHFPIASIPFGDREFLEESGEPEVERGQAFATGLMPQRTAEPGFSNARWAGDQDVVMLPHPLARGETGHQGLVQSAGMPIVDIFDAGRLTEFGLAQARGQPPGVSLCQLAVDQEPEAFLKAERRDVRHLELLDEA